MNKVELEAMAIELRTLKAQKEALTKQIEAIEAKIKKDLDRRGTETLTTEHCEIRWTSYDAEKFDTATFKKRHAELYEQVREDCTRITSARRFSISYMI